MTAFHSCRFCHKWIVPDRDVKYGTRHYAHPRCYLERGKPLKDLHTHQLEGLPYFLLKEFDKLDEIAAIIAARKPKP